ncbi:hypothetical protein K493DRAFT_404657 [Basidiobolus meristosporus CBS 931.73]|uniref:Bacterial surface antigen (D15) domain-containing protein n=1 Tax=Basidiobolus meristosporus CBS 931.73 TaxID=1314790 RepID=A0A1Y1Z321_9FUNG|nr:hypothetical protein K493DRAFT_404657 [Basidiobolus meristosporus CBS 931.73]|eukprot:ORY04504.1 hypothetical protein K493DRAFT_404657 [Basidiobolus meristosporus CBS 931.73]
MEDDELFQKAKEMKAQEEQQKLNAENQRIQEEYERAARVLFDMVSESKDSEYKVHRLEVNGSNYTRSSVFETVFGQTMKSRTLGEIISNTRVAGSRLQRLGIFKDVDITFDAAKDPFAPRDSIDILVNVEERSRFWAKTGTEIGDGEGNMNSSVNFRNAFGAGETFEANASFGTRTSSAFQVSLSKPLNANPDAVVDVTAYQQSRNNKLYSSHEELTRGGLLRFRGISRFGYHELVYDTVWRQIHKLDDLASLSVRNEAGHSVKSSIAHVFMHDRRDDTVLPSNGYYLRLAQEFAGPGGDVSFVKNEVEAQANYSLGRGFILSSSLRSGLLVPLFGEKSHINDRFFLGGPTSVRGFRYAGIGPRDGKDALGGDAYWSGGVSLYTPLPKVKSEALKGHIFVNGGTLLPSVDISKPVPETINRLVKTPSVAVGAGLVYRHSFVRLELNLCLPISVTATDQFKKGIQLGVGMSFM